MTTKCPPVLRLCVHGFDSSGRPIWYTYCEGLNFKGNHLLPIAPSDPFIGQAWSAGLVKQFSGAITVRAHERHQVHPSAWATRPIRGKAPADTPEWTPGPERYMQQLVLFCLACGSESYADVTNDQYDAILHHRVRAIVSPCQRCGSRRFWEPFRLITAGTEKVFAAGSVS